MAAKNQSIPNVVNNIFVLQISNIVLYGFSFGININAIKNKIYAITVAIKFIENISFENFVS